MTENEARDLQDTNSEFPSKHRPKNANTNIITNCMARNIFLWGVYQIGCLVTILFLHEYMFLIEVNHSDPFYWDENDVAVDPTRVLNDPTTKLELYTVIFNAFVMMNIFNLFNARCLENYYVSVVLDAFENWDTLYFFIQFSIVGIQVVMVQFGG